nr:CHAP domain-containing protein [Kibdelosporangium sp. MJ126-NF4]CEL14414.1 Choline binding protein D [Kibdelosporangium sp. MJ126-NF4]CTQ88779.1 Choline binding protein D [Kibdelosporangium sp. MJ126-NF4]
MRYMVVLTACVCLAGVPAAHAATGARIDTPGGPANLRYGPGTQYGITGSAANGQSVTIVCTTRSEPSTGKYGTTTIWNKLGNGTWVAGAFVHTDTPAPAEPECGPTGARPTGDDYPYRGKLNTVDRWLMYSGQCTSWVAWRMEQLHGYFHNYGWRNGIEGHWGNAHEWNDNAVRLGYRVDRIPKPGAIAHWEAGEGGASGLGHVAYVAAVKGSTVTVQEYNWAVDRGYGTRDVPLDRISSIIHYAQGT